MNRAALLLLSACAVACAHTPAPAPEGPSAARFTWREGPVDPRARVFLVAGSSESANFAQELKDQWEIWTAAGVPPERIACYYVPPWDLDLSVDGPQYEALQPFLSRCHLASMARLRADLASAGAAARAGDTPWLYLYVTSHGMVPVSLEGGGEDPSLLGRWWAHRLREVTAMDEFRLVLDTLPDGPSYLGAQVKAVRQGLPEEDVFLTPTHLTQALGAWGGVPKVVALQGCHSGGFLDDPRDPPPGHRLRELDAITVLTASRYDRVSFGCGSDEERTWFGGILGEVLAEQGAPPPEVAWAEVYAEVSRRVLEAEEQAGETPSRPVFHQAP